ncbi:SIR2 family histone deacetylase [Hortaea werneckii]|uniref:Deacetylase sirtuin-type domain-containing protein n=1 Tax=Hortaea werneckii TaxID=91943 RepID=A0A3M7J4U5_HORWE|nr:SIR2 family histone deacetylase [Hortaea werneckii]KAI6832037.1 SIR2 family histone deacetylase [Hortaea werneckii]KAI6952388.1 SIR2 family histone deacetylase [Hortaea werneckii]KAI6958723.1 SIR2 family histone deacetylase [Hortaea werneckii]KAI7008203.1 SIR2 family histone deacetylase [Hortaea werneckii]
MSRQPKSPTTLDDQDVKSFHEYLSKSKRVLALLGAGLSASSGLPTFRGAGGLWRTHNSTDLATPGAFRENPGLVWQFYSYRRHMALQAQPNAAHYALAELARKMPGFQALSQNVDGLSQRADHPAKQLQLLHGTLFEVRCADRAGCGYSEVNFTDPIVPSLAIPTSGGPDEDPTTNTARHPHQQQPSLGGRGGGKQDLDISNITTPLPIPPPSQLPHCPSCQHHLLRPGVVWFGESLPHHVLETVEDYLNDERAPIHLILVVGTSAQVYPAAGYVDEARERGARVCVVNMDVNDVPAGGWEEGDWFFRGDAATVVPRLLEPVIGKVDGGGRGRAI